MTMGPAPKCHFVLGFSTKFLKLGLLQFWRPIALCADLSLKLGLKQSCSPHWDLSNNIWHVTYTQGNQGESWLLVVESQIGNFTPDLSFGHNLCFKCPNGSCEPILDIYVSRTLWWYKKIFNQWILSLAITLWKFESSLGLQLPKWEFIWECGGSFPHTFLHSQEHEMWSPGFTLGPHLCKPLPTFALVASPRLRLQHIQCKGVNNVNIIYNGLK
jgi:hypothetical protein